MSRSDFLLMHLRSLTVVVFILSLLGCANGPRFDPTTIAQHGSSVGMREAAQTLLRDTDSAGRTRFVFDFEHAERLKWNYVPRDRRGLSIGSMSAEQRQALYALLSAGLSPEGYTKLNRILLLEEVLAELENNPSVRDPGAYYLSIFGQPSSDRPWGWRFEGHHLSLNYTFISDSAVAITPAFFGANPAIVETGPWASLQALEAETAVASRLMLMLDSTQLSLSKLPESPENIVSGTGPSPEIADPEGLPTSAMTQEQRDKLIELTKLYLDNHSSLVSTDLTGRFLATIDSTSFSWAGDALDGRAIYYRIHGPSILIEFDNTRPGTNHIHSVMRDLQNDFGVDMLRRHYQESEHH